MQGIFDDEPLSTRSTSVSNYKIVAYPVQIRFKDSDLTTSGDQTFVRQEVLATADPTATASDATGTSDGSDGPTETPTEGDSEGLSTGAQAGIGVGVGLGVLVLIIAAFLFWRRKRKYAKVVPQESPPVDHHQVHEVESTPSQNYAVHGYYDQPRPQGNKRAELSG